MCDVNAAKPTTPFARFARDESGGLLVFALFLFVLMVAMAGLAIDLMRGEAARTELANTLDRCTLMAASLDQRLDPQEVVEDCVGKAGLGNALQSVVVLDGANSRDVRAVAKADAKPFFMHMIGIDSFDVSAGSQAVQKITNVELSLVLDVSGSMQGAKIANLKTAAAEFVETLLDGDNDDRMSIAMVPYNGQVNLGAPLLAQYNAIDANGAADSNCLDLPPVVYGSTAMSNALPMPMTAFADTFSTTNTGGYVAPTDGWAVPNPLNRWCPQKPGNIVRLPNNNIVQLQNQINGLEAIGATSINAGLKWGLTLLDPASRPMFTSLSNAGQIPGTFQGRPFDYSDANTMKVIVLMTDGAHFAEERMNDGFRNGLSPIYVANGTGLYSIEHPTHPGPNKFYAPHNNSWNATAFNSGNGVVRQTWQQVWAAQRMTWVAWQLYGRALGTDAATQQAAYNNAVAMFRTRTATTAMDAQLQAMCAQAKAQNVIIYGIAFEAPIEGQTQISQCASSQQHYFNAQGLSIGTAFASIASNLTMLKLTQ